MQYVQFPASGGSLSVVRFQWNCSEREVSMLHVRSKSYLMTLPGRETFWARKIMKKKHTRAVMERIRQADHVTT